MKWNISKSALLIGIFLPKLALASVEIFTLDPRHTHVQWHVNHFGFSNLSGKWMADGMLILDKTHPEKSRLRVVVQIDNLITGIPELDTQLKSKLFFDATSFPTAIFNSLKIESTDDVTAKVDGMLTLHGVSKPITLYVILNKLGENPLSDSMTAGFSAVAEIKRSDFKINALLPELSDNVILNIEAEAFKTGEAETTDMQMPEIEPTHLTGYGQPEEIFAVEPKPKPASVTASNKNDDPLAFSAAATCHAKPVGLSTESGQKHVWSVDVSTLMRGDQAAITIAGATPHRPLDNPVPSLLSISFESAPVIQASASPPLPIITQAFLKLKTLMQKTVAAAKSYRPVNVVQITPMLATTKQPPEPLSIRPATKVAETRAAVPPLTMAKRSISMPTLDPGKTPAAPTSKPIDYINLQIPHILRAEIMLRTLPALTKIRVANWTLSTINAASFRQAHAEFSSAFHTAPEQTTRADYGKEGTAIASATPITTEANFLIDGRKPMSRSGVSLFPKSNTDNMPAQELNATSFRQTNAAYRAALHREPQQTRLARIAASVTKETAVPVPPDTAETALSVDYCGQRSHPRLRIFMKSSADSPSIKGLDASAFRQANAGYPPAFRIQPQSVNPATATIIRVLKNAIQSELAAELTEAKESKKQPSATVQATENIGLSIFPRKRQPEPGLHIYTKYSFGENAGRINATRFREANAAYSAAYRQPKQHETLSPMTEMAIETLKK